MRKDLVFTETLVTAVEPKRAFRLADECLLEIRVVESRKEAATWRYEYEIQGEFGRIEKFLGRIKSIAIAD